MAEEGWLRLESRLQSEFGPTLSVHRRTSQSARASYLHVMSSNPTDDMNFLPSFHAVFVARSDSKYKILLLAFNGKTISSTDVDLDSGKFDIIKGISENRWSLCKGFDTEGEESLLDEKAPILVDFVDDKIVRRSVACKFAVTSEEGPVCSNCKYFETEALTTEPDIRGDDLNLVKLEPSAEDEFENFDDEVPSPGYDPEYDPLVKPEDDGDYDSIPKPRRSRRTAKTSKQRQARTTRVDTSDDDSRKKSKSRKCLLCREFFNDSESYKLHLTDNPECKIFIRDRNRERKERRLKNRHLKSVTDKPEPAFQKKCPICLDVYTIEKNYIYDRELHEKILKDLDSPVDCPQCGASIDQRRNLNLHFEAAHTNNTGEWTKDKAMCCQCYAVMKRRSLKLHHRIKHEEKKTEKVFLCNVCGKQSSSKQMHELHLARKHGLAPDGISPSLSQVCDQCGRSYVSIDLLRQHVSSMHRDRPKLFCDECGKSFFTRSSLTTHRVCIHLKIHPFKCRLCKYKAGDLSGVYRHYENSHGFRGKEEDVVVDKEALQKVRDITQFNYFGKMG